MIPISEFSGWPATDASAWPDLAEAAREHREFRAKKPLLSAWREGSGQRPWVAAVNDRALRDALGRRRRFKTEKAALAAAKLAG